MFLFRRSGGDLQVTADHAHFWIGHTGDQTPQTIRVEDLPDIGQEKQIARRLRNRCIERRRFAALRNPDQPYTPVRVRNRDLSVESVEPSETMTISRSSAG